MQEPSLAASQQKRNRLANQGDVARSQQLGPAFSLLLLIAVGSAGASGLLNWFETFARTQWEPASVASPDIVAMQSGLLDLIWQIIMLFGSATLVSVSAGIGINFLQTRKLIPKKNRGPLGSQARSQLASLASPEAGYHFLITLAKTASILICAFFAFRPHWQTIFTAIDLPILESFHLFLTLMFKTSFSVAIVMLVFALVDFGYQHFKYERRIRMTPEEQRDEIREIQTDPQIESRRNMLRMTSSLETRDPGS